VEHEKSGFVAKDDSEFIGYVDKLRSDPALLAQMSAAAREHAEQAPSWDSVFGSVYEVYEKAVLGSADPSIAPCEALPAITPEAKADAQLGYSQD
jgi:hypothetical protein